MLFYLSTISIVCSLFFLPTLGKANVPDFQSFDSTDPEKELFEQPFIAISLGSNCWPAWHLYHANLRKRGFPFDTCVTPFESLYKVIENDFKDFFSFNYLQAADPGKSEIVLNTKYNFKIFHTFNTENWCNTDSGLTAINSAGIIEGETLSQSHARKIRRFLRVMNSGIPVYLFRVVVGTESQDKNLIQSQADRLKFLLEEKFPNGHFQLVYIFQKTMENTPEIELRNDIYYFNLRHVRGFEKSSKEDLHPSLAKILSTLGLISSSK